jgi:hypothetical protein
MARLLYPRRAMRTCIVLSLALTACTANDDGSSLSTTEEALLGCWEGAQGTKQVTYRFHSDRTVETGIVGGTLYAGTFRLSAPTALTLDFGEEPPTYQIAITATMLTFTDFPFTFARVSCP